MFAKLALLASLCAAALGAPTPALDTAQHCGQWDTAAAGPYTLQLDQWGISGASGSDCAQVTSASGSTVAWKTTWSWAGGSGVKTYTDIAVTQGLNKQLSAIKSIQVRLPAPVYARD
jgi:xyloglucan-specific endo-beta-1,4-glucanase